VYKEEVIGEILF